MESRELTKKITVWGGRQGYVILGHCRRSIPGLEADTVIFKTGGNSIPMFMPCVYAAQT